MNPESSHNSQQLEKRQAVREIVSLNAGSEQRAQLAMVLLGLKPACELDIYPWNDSPEVVEAALSRAGLVFSKRQNSIEGKTVAEYAVARDEQTVKELLACDPSSDHSAFGMLMGYPESAVKSFKTPETYEGPLPHDIEHSVFKFKFSKANHDEEFETVRRWDRALAEYAPELSEK